VTLEELNTRLDAALVIIHALEREIGELKERIVTLENRLHIVYMSPVKDE